MIFGDVSLADPKFSMTLNLLRKKQRCAFYNQHHSLECAFITLDGN